jgi:hypothetical protein
MRRIGQLSRLTLLVAAALVCACSRQTPFPSAASRYPIAVDLTKVGKYPAATKSGGGYFYDEVLEYRVWVHPGGDDTYRAFATFEEAEQFSKRTTGAEEPLVLVLQRESINEPAPDTYEHVKGDRVTEWQVAWLAGNKRGPDSIAEFLREKAKAREPQDTPADADTGRR